MAASRTKASPHASRPRFALIRLAHPPKDWIDEACIASTTLFCTTNLSTLAEIIAMTNAALVKIKAPITTPCKNLEHDAVLPFVGFILTRVADVLIVWYNISADSRGC